MKKIALRGKYGEGKFVLVDNQDYEKLIKYSWYCHKMKTTEYAERRSGEKHYKMHREILEAPSGTFVDHKNGNGLDNRRSNIRLCTSSQNAYNKVQKNNTSGYKGVFKDHRNRRKYKIWWASITVNKIPINLGHFYTAEEASQAYKKAALKYHGEFAKF